MKPYESYKKTNIPWLDEVPSHWDIGRAKNLYKKENRTPLENDEVVTCFRDGQVTLRKNRRTTGFTESIKEHGYQHIQKGDLVIHVMDAFAGAVGVSDSNGKGTPVYSVCTSKMDINNYYYAHIVKEMASSGFIQSLYRGIRERSSDFRFEVFAAQTLPIPPRTEQVQIVRYLDWQISKINKLVQTKKRQIELLKEQKQAVINKAVTKGLDDSVPMKDSDVEWLGEVPEGWGKNKVFRLFKLVGSGTTPASGNKMYYDNGTIDWINSGDLSTSEIIIEQASKKITQKAIEDYSVLKIYPSKTLVIAMYGASIGNGCIVSSEFCVNQACCCLSQPICNFDNIFAYYCFLSAKISLIESSKGGGQPNISQDIIKQLWLPVPPLEEQQAIVDYITDITGKIDTVIKETEQEIELLSEYKTSLISSVVTGKVDVRDVVVPEFETVEEVTEDVEGDEEMEG